MRRIIAQGYYARLLDTVDISRYAFYDACADTSSGVRRLRWGAKKITEEARDGRARTNPSRWAKPHESRKRLKAKYNRKLTPNERASLFGPELIALTAAYIKNPTEETLADRDAALIGRCHSAAASAVLPLKERIEGVELEIAELWIQMDALREARTHNGGSDG